MAAHLRRALGEDFVVVDSPDHPLVMRSVDVLAGGRAGITAIMMETVEEAKKPKLFAARLTLNKVALPPNTNFIYISKNGSDQLKNSLFSTELTFDSRRWRDDLARIITNPQILDQPRTSERWQKRAESRFADTYRLARALQRRRKRDLDQYYPRSSRSPARDLISNNIEGAFFYGVPSLPALTHLTFEGAERWYNTPDGEPVPTTVPAGAAFADGYPRSPGDPDKVLRAAAFSGWVLAPTHSNKSMDQIGELVFRFTRLK